MADSLSGHMAELVGAGATREELLSCRVGGCGKDTPRLSPEEIAARLPAIPAWELSSDSTVLSRTFVAKNWKAAVEFLNALSAIAEADGHHPDFHLTEWRKVKLEMSTHAIGGLSLADFVVAAKIDAIPTEYSPKWLRENPTVNAQPS